MGEALSCGSRFAELANTLFPASNDGCQYHALIADRPEGSVGFAACAIGFQWGQAEKVASGACHAFMVRPAEAWQTWTARSMDLICTHYGLRVFYDVQRGEYWGCREAGTVEMLRSMIALYEPNSMDWHWMRGYLTGIPTDQIDQQYHLRSTFGVRCEPGVTLG